MGAWQNLPAASEEDSQQLEEAGQFGITASMIDKLDLILRTREVSEQGGDVLRSVIQKRTVI